MSSGQNNPAGIEPKGDKETVPFTPYATVKDGFMMSVFCVMFAWFVFYMPNYLGHADNYIPANPAVTPTHIVPEWYYLPFYAILRAIPNKLLGVLALFGSILILAFLPWLDTVESAIRRAIGRCIGNSSGSSSSVCILLGWLGAKPAEGGYVIAARILTIYYFAHFLVILPLLGMFEKPKPLPNSISESVLRKACRSAPRRLSRKSLEEEAMTLQSRLLHPDDVRRADGEFRLAGRRGRRPGDAAAREMVVRRRVRKIRSRAIAARLQGLSRGLPELPRPERCSSFRNLAEAGGPGFSPAQAAAVAAEYKIKDGPNDAGDMFERPGRVGRPFPLAIPERERGARGQWRRVSAGSLGDGQGAHL